MRVTIVNQPINNRGDEAAHRSMMRELNKRFPHAQFTVLFVNKDQESINEFIVPSSQNRYLNIKSFTKGNNFLKKWSLRLNLVSLSFLHPEHRDVKRIFLDSDLIICAPGGICMGGFQNWEHVYWLYMAKKLGKKIIYLSRSFGPFKTKTVWDKVFKKKSIELLNYFDFLSIRDQNTMKLADELGLSYIETVDTALNFVPRIQKNIYRDLIEGGDYCVYVPNSLKWHHGFKNCSEKNIDLMYLQIFDLIRNKFPGLKIVMLPQLYKQNINDEAYFKMLKAKTNVENIIVISETCGSDLQQDIISKAKFLIGARYHSVVFAINNEIPFVGLSYEHKISGLLRILNLEDRMVNIENLSDEDVASGKISREVEGVLKLNSSLNEPKYKAFDIVKDCFDALEYKIRAK